MTKENKTFDREQLFEECSYGDSQITVDPVRLNSLTHVKGTTLLVSQVLSRLYVHGGIAEVVKYYGDITEEQIKEAIANSVEFMELVIKELSKDNQESALFGEPTILLPKLSLIPVAKTKKHIIKFSLKMKSNE